MKQESAFTLLELLIVISIVGVLSTLAIFSFRGAQGSARDAKKQVEIKQYQVLLETYSLKNNIYPTTAGTGTSICRTLSATAQCPIAPNFSVTGHDYMYQPNAGGTSYVLWVALEKEAKIFISCQSGLNGKIDYVANYDGAGGTCPL